MFYDSTLYGGLKNEQQLEGRQDEEAHHVILDNKVTVVQIRKL